MEIDKNKMNIIFFQYMKAELPWLAADEETKRKRLIMPKNTIFTPNCKFSMSYKHHKHNLLILMQLNMLNFLRSNFNMTDCVFHWTCNLV